MLILIEFIFKMNFDENDYNSEEEVENIIEYPSDIIEEFENDKKIGIVSFYKDILLREPEFIGIKNISTSNILYIIENTTKELKLDKKDYKLNFDQIQIFNRMYSELNLLPNYNIYNFVTKKIFKKIYVK